MSEQTLLAERSRRIVSSLTTSQTAAAVVMLFSIRWFPTSPSAWKLLEGAALVSLLILIGARRASVALRAPPIVPLVGFAIAGLFSEIVQDPTSAGLVAGLSYLVTVAVAASVDTGDSLDGLVGAMWVLRLFVGLSVVVYALPIDHLFESRARGFPIDSHPNELGAVAALLLVLEVHVWRERRVPWEFSVRDTIADAFLVVVPVIALVATSSRTAAITALVGLGVFALCNRATWRWLLVGLVVLTPVLVVSEVQSDSVSGIFEERYESSDGSLLSGRTRAWRIVLERLDDPTLGPVFGHGPSQTLVPTPGVARPEQGIDSGYFLSLSIAGIIGAFAVAMFVVLAGRSAWALRTVRPDVPALFAMLVVNALGQSEIAIIGPLTTILLIRF